MDVSGCRRDDVEIVEQPFGGWRHRLLPRIFGERSVDLAQRAHVVLELAQVGAAVPAVFWRNGEQRRQTPGVLLQQLNTEQFLRIPQCARARERRTHALVPLPRRLTRSQQCGTTTHRAAYTTKTRASETLTDRRLTDPRSHARAAGVDSIWVDVVSCRGRSHSREAESVSQLFPRVCLVPSVCAVRLCTRASRCLDGSFPGKYLGPVY